MELTKKDASRLLIARAMMDDVEAAKDVGIAISNTIGVEHLLTLIANGVRTDDICKKLGVSQDVFDIVMKSTPDLRRRYIQAKCFRLADLSADTLINTGFATATSFSKNEKNAVDFHTANLDRVVKMDTGKELSTGVVVNNTIVVRSKDEIPSLPDGLEDVFDADFTVGT